MTAYTDPRLAALHEHALAIVSALMDLDPQPDSPEGRFLLGIVDAVEQYERAKFPKLRPEES